MPSLYVIFTNILEPIYNLVFIINKFYKKRLLMLKTYFLHTVVILFMLSMFGCGSEKPEETAEADVHTESNLMKHYKNGQTTELPSMNIECVNAVLKDIVFSNDPDSPITCGLFRMEKGTEHQYTYTYDAAKIILEGEMTISEKGGATVRAIAGDILYFDKGAEMTFASNSSGLGFYCGQRSADEL